MDDNNSNAKPKLKETNLKHEHMSQEGIATTTINVEQSNGSRVDIHKS